MKSKSKINIKVKWTFNYSHYRVPMTTVLIIINHFIIYVDIVYLFTRAAKEIKIQLHTQLFKLYHSAAIIEHTKKKINQPIYKYKHTNKIIYKKNILIILEHKLVYWSNKLTTFSFKCSKANINSSFRYDEAFLHFDYKWTRN